MDKCYKPMTAIEQMNKRLQVLENINNNPEWQIYQIASYIRKELHLTLNEMSKITKIAPQTLQKMEQPDSNPTLDSINKLLNAFGLKFIIKSK